MAPTLIMAAGFLPLPQGEGADTKNGNRSCRFAFGSVRPDALTPTLSHRERVQTLKTTTDVAVLQFTSRSESIFTVTLL